MKDGHGTRTGEVMAAIRSKVSTRALVAGDRLPSIRSFAATMGVSPSTIVEAYDRLAAEGLIRARRGSGFYVAGHGLPPLALSEAEPRRDRAVDPFWVSRQSLDADPAAAKPGCGWLPADWMPHGALRRALRILARAEDSLLADYGGTRGSPALRRLLLGRFAAEGLEIAPDRIMLTGSGTQAIDLICRFLLRPGDTVLVDDPCYFNFRALLRAHQVRIVGVPYTPSGPDVAAFETILSEERPRLYITNSALHNPTGATLSPQAAYRVLNAASAHDLTIVEDDIFADFEPEPSPRLAVLDGLDRVIRIGSFSKTLSASIRCGYIAARADWIECLVDLQVATSFGGPSPVATQLIAGVLAGGGYRKHMEELRQRLARARHEVAIRLEPLGIQPWHMPRGGFYLWCRLPEGRDSAALARAAVEENVVLAPGNVFSVSQTAGSFLRFNVAQSGDPRIISVLGRAMGVHRAA
ncbi:PLP-dependent aminotransferase family protein [Microvirga makkahensis]|uniref:8-amino-7-oxononanoate synthase n=1 Tax=Microvirga makkahensis TaxID=1128670 RepID=A0A7X3SRM6_9HYPH|nr:PLP-dependent aminotransferase family protein [Microvirga makkahensis]MXQ14239.1 aminotransferase class I/II-fold pyridoxal phosphate-dependent enzyme [Microvirga makkahensis]